MSINAKVSKASKAKRAELERRLSDIRNQENHIKERIYKLEASIVSTPSRVVGERLRMWNTVPADEEMQYKLLKPRTRYQKKLVNRGRSHQALTAMFFVTIAVLMAIWFTNQLRSSGIL